MVFRIALIEADDSFQRVLGGKSQNLSLDTLKRREVQGHAAAEIDHVNPPVLVSIVILQVEDMLIGVSPGVASNAAIGVIGHRLCSLRRICRSHPYIEHSLFRCEKAEIRAVGADSGGNPIRIAEEHITGNKCAIIPILLYRIRINAAQ